MKKLSFLCLLVIFAIGATPAFAVPVCSTSDVSGAIDCMDGVPDTSNDSEALLNDNSYFGFSDWEYLSKYDVDADMNDPEGEDIGLSVTPAGYWHTGAYSFNSNVWDRYEQILIVLKDGGVVVGSGSESYTNYWSAYLLGYGNSAGDWTYPEYLEQIKDLSHLSVYGRGAAPVPEPATMLLMGSGLIGLAGIGRKKLKK